MHAPAAREGQADRGERRLRGADRVRPLRDPGGSLPWKLMGEAIFFAAAFPEHAQDHARILDVLNHEEGPGRITMK